MRLVEKRAPSDYPTGRGRLETLIEARSVFPLYSRKGKTE
jgi:hypothetical protein